jgi:tetratricopeptide (TPR) repeat protein
MVSLSVEGLKRAEGRKTRGRSRRRYGQAIFLGTCSRTKTGSEQCGWTLQGKEKAWGPEHRSTLDTVNNLGILYKDLGQLDEAEKMYQRALDGYAQAISPVILLTYVPALNNMWAFASLRESQSRVEDSRHWYSQALIGYEKTFGLDHGKCEPLRTNLALLARREEEQSSSTNKGSIKD